MDKVTRKRQAGWGWVIFSFIVGVTTGLMIAKGMSGSGRTQAKGLEIRQGGYTFINPLLECEVNSQLFSKELKNFKYKIESFVDSKIRDGQATNISVYFRDLNNGPVFAINGREGFSPASLLKIPVMISWLKKAESDPQILKKMIKYGSAIYAIAQDFKPEKNIKEGESYTVGELIYRMIVYSDNQAKNLLLMNIDEESLDKTYRDLSIAIPDIRKPEDFMDVTTYASFFRILYNASYLNKEMSELALSMLSENDFDNGLRAGVPESVQLANKFGERTIDKTRQLHDCGIFYYKDRPYLLCVMTRGKDFDELCGIISEISRLVYIEVDSQYRKSS